MKPILSIGITSYKRINELERCIKSVDTKYIDDIEIIVSEDCSPLSKEIGEHVETLSKQIPYELKFMPNEHNLGYDGNLGAIIKKSRGEYVFLMSDDDAFFPGFLDVLVPFIKEKSNKYGVIYAPFVYSNSRRKDRNHGKDHIIEANEANASKYIFDSILFSGLVFKKKYVEQFDSSSFLNMNFFQVYLFLKSVLNIGGYYFSKPSVLCIGDGENAYGSSESSGGNELLVDRTNVISNVEFDKTLFKVIRRVDEEEGTQIFKSFEKQYSFRAYTLMSIARLKGREELTKYWNNINNHGIKIYPIAKVYYFLLYILGTNFSNKLTYFARRLAKKDEKCD